MKFPIWYKKAQTQIGTLEADGSKDNPKIIEYHAETSLKATHDSVPWCASFVSWCLETTGVKSTRSARARSYLDWGIRLDTPIPGCVVVLSRGTAHGHVGFFTGVQNPTGIEILGGNQHDQVCVAVFLKSRVIAYRWPHEVPLPSHASSPPLPIS